jgi:hypothetical protein
MFVTILIASLVIVALAFVGLGFNIIFRKNGQFPDTEVGSNPHMKKMGITCAKQDEVKSYRELQGKGKKADSPEVAKLKDCGYGCSCAALDEC